ncbi:hypothetical protein ABOM_004990 [Aspergillus bombycis]|uniref:Zn(2)-C6 fungal-type domain-containing protein n=1 Tax=Aspergillus bombycis TaxID=109264 RepID=A0A1F8A515_9EURO|nr:hypothetical protein ABOM_004990 [Aspergillus bombycis]OGM46830.1 hypothetical protein ABOM_004990 [Aspergillus bombycis]
MIKLEGIIWQKRKSRGRGLRATTGCLICKRRHVKCDEVHPQCGPCAKGRRPCVYAHSHRRDVTAHPGASESPPDKVSGDHNSGSNSSTRSLQVVVDSRHQGQQSIRQNSSSVEAHHAGTDENVVIPTPKPSDSYVSSSGTQARSTPLRWLQPLAKDVNNPDGGFLLSPSQVSRNRIETGEDSQNSSNLRPHTLRDQESFHATAFSPEIGQRVVPQSPGTSSVATKAPSSWTSRYPIPLSDVEHHIFQHFVRVSSKLLDFYDPEMHFATAVSHIALQNVGLIKALLALSARHLSLGKAEKDHVVRTSAKKDEIPRRGKDTMDRNLAAKYYSEALDYLNKAMQYPSHARSLDLIVTAILISTYEMIDGSNQNWERHLKGISWRQQLQGNNGESGGLRSAVWWAWLQQDIWAAIRRRRRVFSFWKPRKPVSTLMMSELATRALYLLSQCINYASKEEEEASGLERRVDRGNELLSLLQEWREVLPPEYSPLPSVSSSEIFPPIWVHPPSYAAALQIYSLALILVILHRPSTGGIDDYRSTQHMLAVSVSTICGIARSVDENDEAANMTSLNCLFGGRITWNLPLSYNANI